MHSVGTCMPAEEVHVLALGQDVLPIVHACACMGPPPTWLAIEVGHAEVDHGPVVGELARGRHHDGQAEEGHALGAAHDLCAVRPVYQHDQYGGLCGCKAWALVV